MEAITLKDIAKALNLSTSTVSRALRGSYEINPETKRLVVEYAERMNYRPNPIALSLKENRSRAIGVIVPQIANHFFSQAINGIDAVAYSRGYHVIIFQSHESYEREVVTVQQCISRKVDGLLISLSRQTTQVAHLKELQEKAFPMVMFDRVWDDLDTPKIVADNFQGAFEATEHLLQTGRRRIAHLTVAPWLSITQERLAGYQAALAKYSIPYDEALVRYCNFGDEVVVTTVDELLAANPAPDAFFTASDRLALGCLAALRKRKVSIPEAVSLIGFTNLSVADLLAPSLSTVVQPAEQIGQLAAERLIDLIEHKPWPAMPQIHKVSAQLIVRESSIR